MPKPLFVAGSDNHIEYCAYVAYPAMWGDSHFAFTQEVDKAIELGVPLVAAGDVFDKPYPDPYSIRSTFLDIDRLKEAGCPFLFTQGQHELNRKAPWLSLHPHPTHINNRLGALSNSGLRIVGLDWQPPDLLANALQNQCFKHADILICHQVWSQFMGPQTAPEGSIPEVVPDNVRLVVTGDFHGHKLMDIEYPSGKPLRILSPGSATLQAIGEDPNKYFFVVYDDYSVRSVALRGRKVCYSRAFDGNTLENEIGRVVAELDASEKSGVQQLLPANLRTPMWVAQYHWEVPDAAKRLKAAAAGRAHLFLRPFGKEQEQKTETVVSQRVRGLNEALATLVDRNMPEYNTASRLLSAQCVRDELVQIVEECLNEPAKQVQELAAVGPALVEPEHDQLLTEVTNADPEATSD